MCEILDPNGTIHLHGIAIYTVDHRQSHREMIIYCLILFLNKTEKGEEVGRGRDETEEVWYFQHHNKAMKYTEYYSWTKKKKVLYIWGGGGGG